MLSFLPGFLRGLIASTLLVVNTLFWCLVLFVLALVKLLLPIAPLRRRLDAVLNAIATAWVSGNSAWMRLTQRTDWQVEGIEPFTPRGWYLVVANHQSWVDIFVLQRLFNRRIPLLKFFLKQELIYVPVIGLAWWALDFPFMRRHSEAYLLKHPERRHDDIEATRRACRKFAHVPTSVMNFVEGTRFTPEKHAAQKSRYKHLLKPRAGGLGMALNALGERFDSLADVTIVYPDGAPSFWQFLCGGVPRIQVHVERREIPRDFFAGDFSTDPGIRKQVQRWLLELWREKDARIGAMLGGDAGPGDQQSGDAGAGEAKSVDVDAHSAS
ncbi:MAG: acyltransferase [Burkholderiaceae bacterium]